MSRSNEYNYQGRFKRAINLLLFSLAGLALGFASIYLLTRYHFGRNDISSNEIEIPKNTMETEETIKLPFHFQKPDESILNDFSTDILLEPDDILNEDESETNSESEFSWPELFPYQR